MKHWETLDGEVDDELAYGVWYRRDVDLESQRLRRHRASEEARENMSKAQKKRRRRAR